MAQSPKGSGSSLKNEEGMLLIHPEFGRLAGQAAVEKTSYQMFQELKKLGVEGIRFGEVLAYEPHWLNGLNVHDGLAYEQGPKIIFQWIEDLAGRFTGPAPERPAAHEETPDDTSREKRQEKLKAAALRARKWFTRPPQLNFAPNLKLVDRPETPKVLESKPEEVLTADEINEAIDDLLPSL